MAKFAEVDGSNTVINVAVVHDDVVTDEQAGIDFLNDLYPDSGTWIQTSSAIRQRYAGVGYTYDADLDVFISPQPYPSWTLDENTDWQPPTSMPDGDICHFWDEDTTSWIEAEAS
jgi:hypothetical protein